jgi:hypothetical protein
MLHRTGDAVPSLLRTFSAGRPLAPGSLAALTGAVFFPGRLLARFILAGAATVLCACGAIHRQQFGDLYPDTHAAEQPPLIVIPGILGSRLSDPNTGKVLWPISLRMLITGWRPKHLTLPIEEEPTASETAWKASGIVLSSPGRDYYTSFLRTLEDVGYHCVTQYEITTDTNCIVFVWDWRKGLVEAASELNDAIERMRAVRRRSDLKVDLVAHSAGSTIARYYARFGGKDVIQTGAEYSASPPHSIRKMVLIGPLDNGSLATVEGLMRGYRAGPFAVRPEVLATFETSFQLLPSRLGLGRRLEWPSRFRGSL